MDEAHNMVERARKMYTAELDQVAFKIVRRTAPVALKKPLDRLNRHWNDLHQNQHDSYQVYTTVPVKFITALQQVISAISEYRLPGFSTY